MNRALLAGLAAAALAPAACSKDFCTRQIEARAAVIEAAKACPLVQAPSPMTLEQCDGWNAHCTEEDRTVLLEMADCYDVLEACAPPQEYVFYDASETCAKAETRLSKECQAARAR